MVLDKTLCKVSTVGGHMSISDDLRLHDHRDEPSKVELTRDQLSFSSVSICAAACDKQDTPGGGHAGDATSDHAPWFRRSPLADRISNFPGEKDVLAFHRFLRVCSKRIVLWVGGRTIQQK